MNRRKPFVWLLAAAAGAALFASGGLVARATLDNDDQTDPANGANKIILPGVGSDLPATGVRPAITGPGDMATTNSGRGSDAASYPACRAPLPAGVVANGVIDPSKAGFVPALPTTGFEALSLSLSMQGECNDLSGRAVTGSLVLDSSWTHTGSGLDVYISQRASPTKLASVFRQDGATFWADGYVFNVNVNGYPGPIAVDMPGSGPTKPVAPDSGAGSSSTSGGGTSSAPSVGIAPQPDPRVSDVLRELVGQLAPSLDQKCFWSQAAGDWSALGTIGVGDPRPAIPAGFTQTDLNVVALVAPAAGCDTSLKPTEGFSLNAGWQKNQNNADYAYIGVSVNSSGSPQAYPGQISEYGANWSNGAFSFGVYAKSEKALGLDTVRAIAKALDPSFNEACFIKDRELAESELAGLGFKVAKAPDGYKLTRASLHVQEISAGCDKPDGFQSSYNLNWAFEKGADMIEASTNRYDSQNQGDGSGYQSGNSLNWTDAKGTSYYVNAYSTGISPTVAKDDLITVAKSMDPSFDITKLQEGGPEKPFGIPAPVEEKTR
ncbi:MAG: hypothetical protein ABI577_11305 [bacterium]